MARFSNRCSRPFGCFFALLLATLCIAPASALDSGDNLDIALALADVLRASRTEIASQQGLINDPAQGDKGLSGDKILNNILARLKADKDFDPQAVDPNSLAGRLLVAQLEAIREIADENQVVINREGVGFKGFVPAVFAQLVNERFSEKVGDKAQMKVTAPMHLVRNRKARPDRWERSVIEERFGAADWPRGELYHEVTDKAGDTAFRVMVPEYYGKACLACHGSPKGEVDITGYPKEGGAEGELGGSISITLFQ